MVESILNKSRKEKNRLILKKQEELLLSIKKLSKLKVEELESSAQYAPTEFMLGDIKSNSQYATNLDALQSANSNEIIYKEDSEFIGVYDDVNPNMPKQTYVIFEVPKDMVITDGVMTNVNGGADPVGYYIK